MKSILKPTSYIAVLLLCMFSCQQQKKSTVETVILNGLVLDGMNKEAYKADIGINADTIAFVGNSEEYDISEALQIDASGYYVTPGFIDPHTHAFGDLSNKDRSANLNYLTQGVTTVITGNDGGGPVKIDSILNAWQEQGIGTNAALYVGHGTVRRRVMGTSDAQPELEQLASMKRLVSNAMDEGALGLSTGLYYAPGSFSETSEVIELARVAATKGGIYDSHIRDESSYNIGLLEAVKEVIEISRQSGIPAHIAHIKALGVDVWGKSSEVIELIQSARAEGLEITADQYPYIASGTGVSASLVPKWVFANNFLEKFDDPELLPRIKLEMEDNLRRRGGPGSILITRSRDTTIIGKTLEEISNERNNSPIEAAIQIIKNGDAGVASFNMNINDVNAFMQQPWVMTGSDGSSGHPRKFGSYPRKIREFVIENEILTLEEFVTRSTSLVAETHKIAKRGTLQEGYYADILVFNPNEVTDNATFENPELLSTGMHYVIVNGEVAIDNGNYTEVKPGKALRRSQ